VRAASSLDHLVSGGEQRFWDGAAEGFGGLEVNHHLDFVRLLDRQAPRNIPSCAGAPAPAL
jgi:hypothetical protein